MYQRHHWSLFLKQMLQYLLNKQVPNDKYCNGIGIGLGGRTHHDIVGGGSISRRRRSALINPKDIVMPLGLLLTAAMHKHDATTAAAAAGTANAIGGGMALPNIPIMDLFPLLQSFHNIIAIIVVSLGPTEVSCL